MIEVERKFRPTPEQLENLLKDAEFLGENLLEDVYYDYPDYRLYKEEVRIRLRNNNFELKIGDDDALGIAQEIEKEEDIKTFFKTEKPMDQFISENMKEIINYSTKRKKYKNGKFSIDVDELSFGYKCVEIELMVDNEQEVEKAKQKILEFAQSYGWEEQDVPPKRKEYFRLMKPEVYKELYS